MVQEAGYSGWAIGGTREKAKKAFLPQFIYWSWVIIAIAALLQCAFFSTTENILAVAYVVLAWIIVTNTVLQPNVLKGFPLSSYLIIGFSATQFVLPLLFTLLESKPITYNLKLPGEVFLHSILALGVLIIAHWIYRFVIRGGRPVAYKKSDTLLKAGLFTPPTDLQVWLIGFLGMVAMFYVYFYIPSTGRGPTGPFEKTIEALAPFTYAPYFIPFSPLYGRSRKDNKALILKLVAFTIILFVISLGTNSRGAFMLGFTSLGYSFGLGLLIGIIKTRLFTLKNIVLGLIALWLLVGPLADIGTAMVMVRSLRADTPRSELVSLTWDAFQDKKALNDFRSNRDGVNAWGDSWDETYLNNIFLARFCNIKFNDISLDLAAQIDPDDSDMRQYSLDRIIVMLPQPVLTALGVNVDKDAVNSIAYGDFMYYKATGNADVFGSRLTGHFAGTGMASFGWWYLLILGVAIIPVFALCDLLSTRNAADEKKQQDQLIFSFCGLLTLTSIFQFLPTESVTGAINFLLRTWIQLVLLYLLLYHVTRRLSMILLLTTSPKGPARRRNEILN